MTEHRHPWLRRVLGFGLFAGLGYALWRAIQGSSAVRDADDDGAVEAAATAVQEVPPASTTSEAWVEADGGVCPASHPVKGKLKSGIYHLPGGQSYDRTTPDRCYVDERAAQADGLRAAKR
jgi:hypothetical protein